MRKFLLKFFIAISILILLPIIYLSTIGIETDIYNEQIKNKVNESNKNLQLNLKKIKLRLLQKTLIKIFSFNFIE